MKNHVIAIDIGGTKIASALINTEGHIVYQLQDTPTCQTGMVDGFSQIVQVVETILSNGSVDKSSVLGIGIGIPAVLESETDLIIWAPNITGWENFPLRARLQEYFHLPVFIEYDGHTAVLGEWWKGAARGHQTIAMVIIGTGVGGGLIINGQLHRGFNRLAGAVGWFAMTDDHQIHQNASHGLGHWESLVAGPGIAQRAKCLLSEYQDSALTNFSEENITAKTVFDYARKNDRLCIDLVNNIANIIGLGLSNIVDLINPEIIILGGSIGTQDDLLLPNIEKTCKQWAQPSSAQSVIIKPSQLGKDSGVFGAGYAVILRSKCD